MLILIIRILVRHGSIWKNRSFMLAKNEKCKISCIDGVEGLKRIPDESIKLVYGSPPYPNAERNYGVWKEENYINRISPFIEESVRVLENNGFLVINVKANRTKKTSVSSSKRSLVIEKLSIMLEEIWNLYCVDIEIWIKGNPVPTGLRSACQDAYEQILWFSKSSKWSINIDAIRRPYSDHSLELYNDYEYKARSNGLKYVRKNKNITPNPKGALPQNVIYCGVVPNKTNHQAVQPISIPQKYIRACTNINDIVVDPWLGSGTTAEAALQLNRKFIGFDIFQEYIDLTNERIKEYL